MTALKPLTLSNVGNFGGTLPTGSGHKYIFVALRIDFYYLNIGTGKACAGHSNVTVALIVTSVISIIFVATFGAALPNGSKNKLHKGILKFKSIYIPEGRGRVSLSGTQDSDAITSISIKCATFVACSKFR